MDISLLLESWPLAYDLIRLNGLSILTKLNSFLLRLVGVFSSRMRKFGSLCVMRSNAAASSKSSVCSQLAHNYILSPFFKTHLLT